MICQTIHKMIIQINLTVYGCSLFACSLIDKFSIKNLEMRVSERESMVLTSAVCALAAHYCSVTRLNGVTPYIVSYQHIMAISKSRRSWLDHRKGEVLQLASCACLRWCQQMMCLDAHPFKFLGLYVICEVLALHICTWKGPFISGKEWPPHCPTSRPALEAFEPQCCMEKSFRCVMRNQQLKIVMTF